MTTTLSKKLAELRDLYQGQHREEYDLLVELNRRLESQDAHLTEQLAAVLDNQEVRRAEVHRLVLQLAARVGLLPAPAAAAPPPAIETEPPIDLPTVFERERVAAERVRAGLPPSNGHYDSLMPN